MIVGKLICDKCGKDCTNLRGFVMRRNPSLTKVQSEALAEVREEFGKDEFVFCWSCTAKAFGAVPVLKKEESQEGE